MRSTRTQGASGEIVDFDAVLVMAGLAPLPRERHVGVKDRTGWMSLNVRRATRAPVCATLSSIKQY